LRSSAARSRAVLVGAGAAMTLYADYDCTVFRAATVSFAAAAAIALSARK